MKLLRFFLTLIAASTLTSLSYACSFDTDCSVGSQCVKNGGLYGVCQGGMSPGNANDRQPVYNPLDLNTGSRKNRSDGDARKKRDSNGTYGDTCSFDLDCGIGRSCAKSGGLYGVCK